jgi:hypothetical protein
MALNFLLYRQQIELMRADAALCSSSRFAHREMARLYMIEAKRFADPALAE